MAAKLRVGVGSESKTERLRRLSVVFAVLLRLKIVTELYMRPMSPKQFYEEFGGGSISRVTRNFDRLADTGWLRHVENKGPGGKRRGMTEHFYRAPELAFCDQETWAMLPYSIRVAFSWNSFVEIAQRLRDAIEAGTFDPTRNLDFTRLSLDETGWERVIGAIAEQFVLLFEGQTDAAIRMIHSGEKPIRASIIHIAFESPGSIPAIGPALAEGGESLAPFPVRLSKVLPDPICIQIIEEANRRDISAPLFYREIGGDSPEGIRRRFKKIADLSLLKPVGTKTGGRRRSAKEIFYRATGPANLDSHNGPWANVPDSLRNTKGWATFKQLSELVKEAMRAGTFDARVDGCLAWSLVQLDRKGWEKVIAELDDLVAFVLKEEERAKVRLRKSGEKPIAMTVALGGFESPKELEREE
jgi:hypothetical protein